MSAGLTKVSDVHLVNTTTASNFSKSVDSKLDNIRESSAETGESLMKKAHHMFYAAGKARGGRAERRDGMRWLGIGANCKQCFSRVYVVSKNSSSVGSYMLECQS